VGKAKVVVAAALLLVSGASATPDSESPVLDLPVVFRTDWVPRYRTADVYVIPAHGGRRRALTRNEVDDVHPAWSPNGRTIVFSRQGDLFTMSQRGRAVRRLTRTAVREVDAAWSPDGRRLAFERRPIRPRADLRDELRRFELEADHEQPSMRTRPRLGRRRRADCLFCLHRPGIVDEYPGRRDGSTPCREQPALR
jgi:dipeptidyl aminopeptidase/acylaminoacyl peptidase